VPDYDFHTLTAVDFEDLTRDLIQAQEGIRLQSFKTGRDGGIDFRFARDEQNLVVQCKHMRKSGYRLLLREVKKEAEKLRRLDPPVTRYVLATSVELNNAEKEALAAHLPVSSTDDILGGGDINNLLGLHERIQTAHFKLWLPSSAVLQRVLHNAAATKSAFEFKRIRSQAPRFVRTSAYDAAAEQLDRDRVLILSGLPGVGKTTLAELLLYSQAAGGIEPVIARRDIAEAMDLHREGVPQIFFYDDFLGATYLGEGGAALVRNEDREIADFIAMVAADKDKRLILTTREHILAQAINGSERLRHSRLGDFRYVVKVGDYTREQRARILYNHVWFSDLPQAWCQAMLDRSAYHQVVDHEKFSPRLMEWITTYRRVKEYGPDTYVDFIRSLLEDPSEIWLHAYNKQISHAGRSLLLALHSLDGRASFERLEPAFDRLHAYRAERYRFERQPDDFRTALRILGEAFITILPDAVTFIDPSVRDLMNTIWRNAPDNAVDVICASISMTQVKAVWGLAQARNADGALIALLARKADDLADPIRHAFAAPVGFSVDGMSGTYSPVIEDRLNLLVNMARDLRSRRLSALIAPMAQSVMETWRDAPPNVPSAVRSVGLIDAAASLGDPSLNSTALAMRSALMTQTGHALEPRDIVNLLELLPVSPPSLTDIEALRRASEEWPPTMGDRLRDCRSEDALVTLANDLDRVSRALGVDLAGPINATRTEIKMYVEPEEPEPRGREFDGRHRPSWMERHTVDDLFDTLRTVEETGDDG
jgi:hypothetical protein